MRPQELNLMMIFDAIMTEGSITRAANRLAMTQPAVSNALSRMRQVWKDELFVKDGRGIQPTVFAHNLWSQIRGPLGQLEEAINPDSFDPKTARRTFRVAVKDIFVDMAWSSLRRLIEREAPNIDIHAIPNTLHNHEQILNDAEVDLVVGAMPLNSSVIRNQFMLDPRYVCVMRLDHPLARDELSLDDFLKADHMLISASGDVTGVVDLALANMGLSRRVAMSVNHYMAIVPLLKNSNLISVVPSLAVEQALFNREIAVFEPPLELPPTPVSMLWHKRQDNDAGLTWLRKHLLKIIQQNAQRHYDDLARCCRKAECAQARQERLLKEEAAEA